MKNQMKPQICDLTSTLRRFQVTLSSAVRPSIRLRRVFSLPLAILCWMQIGCATGPLTNGYTARSLGQGKFSADIMATGYESAKDSGVGIVPSVRLNFGLTDSLDLSFHTELKSYGVMAKYVLIENENPEGFALAFMGAVYGMGNRSSTTLGGVASYSFESGLEPYGIVRYNMARIDTADFDAKYLPKPSSGNFDFFYGTIGAKYWLMKDAAIGTEFSFAPGLEHLDPSRFLVVHTTFVF